MISNKRLRANLNVKWTQQVEFTHLSCHIGANVSFLFEAVLASVVESRLFTVLNDDLARHWFPIGVSEVKKQQSREIVNNNMGLFVLTSWFHWHAACLFAKERFDFQHCCSICIYLAMVPPMAV